MNYRIVTQMAIVWVASAALPTAAHAEQAMPRYRFTVGQALVYETTLRDKPEAGVGERLRAWVVNVGENSRARILLKKEPLKSGTVNETAVSLAYADITPDGSITPNPTLSVAVQARNFFPKQPETPAENAAGWKDYDPVLDLASSYTPRADGEGSECTVIGPLIEGGKSSRRYTWDAARGLATEVVFPKGRMTRLVSTRLESPEMAATRGREAEAYFAAVFAHDRRLDAATRLPTEAAARDAIASARSVFAAVVDRLTTAEIKAVAVRTLAGFDAAADAICKPGGLRERTSRVLGSSPGDWEAVDITGKRHTAKDYRGRVVVADFWYRNCPACILAMPQVKAIGKHLAGRPVALLGMNIDEDEADARFMAEQLELPDPTLRAAGLEDVFHMEDFGYPTLFIIDQEGVIRSLRIGHSPTLAEEVIAEVEKLLGSTNRVSTPAAGVEFHVSPTGDDAAQGTAEAPFRSLERARDAVRAARKDAAVASEAVAIVVHPGVYSLAAAFTLTAADGGTAEAPVVYRSAEPGRAILRGSVPLTGFAPAAGGVLTADVKAAGLGGKPFKLLFWNGRRLELARYPNIDPTNPFETGWAFTAAEPVPAETIARVGPKRIMRLAAEDRGRWADPSSGEVSIFPSHEWWNNVLPIAAVDEATGLVELKANGSYDITPGDRYFVRGLREHLDVAGEWHLDRTTGVVSLIPPEPLADDVAATAVDTAVRAPRNDTLVQFDPGVAHVEFRGFVIEECGGTAVRFVNAEHCTVADCTIRACGDEVGDGVGVSGGRGNAIVNCEISDTGRHGISLTGGDFKTLAPGDHRAEGNRIARTGVIHKQGCGVNVSGVGNRVVGNVLHDLPRFGVMFSGANLVVEGNRIERVSLETMDTAAIYGGSLDWRHGHGCIVRGNVVKDVIGRSGKAGVWKSPFFAWGIYLDWSAMGMTVEGNTVVRCPRGGIMLHDGRDNTVVGNTIIDCGSGTYDGQTGQIEASGWNTSTSWWVREYDNWCRQYDEVKDHPAWQAMKSFRDPRTAPLADGRTMHGHVIERNILAWHAPDARPFRFRNVPENHNRCDHNRLWHDGQPIKTGEFRVKSVVGESLAGPNPGFEHGAAGEMPDAWTWSIQPSPADTAVITTDDPRSGTQCLRIEGVPDQANAAKELWARLPGVRGGDMPLEQGGLYRLSAWLRADAADTPVEIGFTAYKSQVHHWVEMRRFVVGPEWSRHEVIARVPEQTPVIDATYLRFRLSREAGVMFVDDVELHRIEPLDEWAAWQAAGWDRHSVIADPGPAALTEP
jgi:parallel beta-helix repeat protein